MHKLCATLYNAPFVPSPIPIPIPTPIPISMQSSGESEGADDHAAGEIGERLKVKSV